ncbi:desmethyl-deoxy-podophyllotoxin synthase-like [Corylus avellana]|uniref:desmethyl-deoxy-podophyllotoxin synthase-like n=1 Tax=Corylus avellana TaxID=13451 RepID=UPI00286D0B34|nr:desmethyl-deoxy-podophyllotoxin synthase-like [Corylus avellana]
MFHFQGLSFPLSSWLFFSFFNLFILFICWKRCKARGQVLQKLPPGPWKLPLIGNLHQLAFSSLPHRSMRDLAKKHGPIMQLQLGEVSAIIISSPDLAKQVLKTHDTAFANRPSALAAEVLSYGYSGIVFTPYGDYWRQIRKICVVELLSAKRVLSFRSVREEEACNLVESISLSGSGGFPINLSEKIFSFTNRIASRAAFGKKCKYEKEFISLVREGFSLSGGFNVPDLFPSLKFLAFLTGMKPALEKLHRKMDKILEDIIEEKMQTITTTKDDDIVDVLLQLRETGGVDFNITTNHIKAVTLDVVSGASETSATTIEWAMSELLRNPRAMEKAQAEVRRVFEGKRNIDETDIEKLDYLKFVVKETLRLHPPGALLPRESREKCELSGYMIPSNTKVVINVWAIGRDPEYWIDADCFRPERFHSSCIDFKGTKFEYIPFGDGKRICPGISFALATIELALSQLLYRFNWKLPNDIKLEELDMSEFLGLSCKRNNDLHLVATPWIPLS